MLEVLSRTTLVVMIDDPLFSKTLGEFLQQIQGGLSQGSANSGICTPKGSILISSNSDAVERYLSLTKQNGLLCFKHGIELCFKHGLYY